LPSSVGDLREIAKSAPDRGRLTELLAIRALLANCIIDANYRLADDWVRPLKLSDLGEEVRAKCMQTYRRLKPNDVMMAVFLQFGCAAGLLADLQTDIDALRSKISQEVLNRHIRYPYIFGRELHDTAAEMFPRRTQLDNRQTIRLLDALPIGSFQVGRTVVGPYGCTYSDDERSIGPSFFVPGYLCSDPTCHRLHRIRLETGESSIARARKRVSDFIDKNYSETEDEYWPIIREAMVLEYAPLRPEASENLIDVLSDGLSEQELRSVVDNLFRRTFKQEGRRLDVSKRLGAAIANPTEFVSGIGRPELMQIAMIHSDSDLIESVEEAVRSESIPVQEFEVRVSKVRRWDISSLAPRAEIGALGVRFAASPSSRLIARRMLRLLHSVYYESDLWDAADLAYALDAAPDLSDGELLERAVRQFSPTDLFRRLILTNRRAVAITCEKLGVSNFEGLSREDLLERLLWKVGEPGAIAFAEVSQMEHYAKSLDAANRERRATDALRSESINLFTAAENALRRSLVFCTWAFAVDHYVSKDGFEYDPQTDPGVVEFIESNAPVSETEMELKRDGTSTLVALSAGFARLAKALRKLDPTSSERPSEQILARCLALSQPFAFPYTIPFLNLSDGAKSDVLVALQTTSRLMQDEDVIDLRNATAHGNRPFPDNDHIQIALQRLFSLVAHLRATGLYPRLFDLVRLSRDELGREELTYESGSDEVRLFRPEWAIAPRLPLGQARLIIVPAATTTSSGPLRFRLKPRPGSDPYWDGWPRRWTVVSDYGADDEAPGGPEELSQTA
jgi:hypothetical protein